MFRIPTRIRLAPGCLNELPAWLDQYDGPGMLVTDGGVRALPWFASLESSLTSARDAGIRIVDDIEANPRAGTIDRHASEGRAEGLKWVVAVGGGSALDAGKAISMLLTNEGSITDFEGKNQFDWPAAPFVAAPTTCGTGSEVTWVSVVSVPEKRTKISIKGDGMFPAAAFVDANVLATLPGPLIASTGMDAMTHAIEAFIAKGANPASDALAMQAVRMLIRHLGPCIRSPERSDHRAHVMHASTLAGMSFGNADVGAVHCLSEAIGGVFDHPHGLLNTLLLTPVLRYQFVDIRDRLRHLSAFLGAPRPETLLERLETMITEFPLGSWSDLAIPEDAFSEIAHLAEANGSNASNRKDMKAVDYHRILASLAEAAESDKIDGMANRL